jgi:hypothetical protein
VVSSATVTALGNYVGTIALSCGWLDAGHEENLGCESSCDSDNRSENGQSILSIGVCRFTFFTSGHVNCRERKNHYS